VGRSETTRSAPAVTRPMVFPRSPSPERVFGGILRMPIAEAANRGPTVRAMRSGRSFPAGKNRQRMTDRRETRLRMFKNGSRRGARISEFRSRKNRHRAYPRGRRRSRNPPPACGIPRVRRSGGGVARMRKPARGVRERSSGSPAPALRSAEKSARALPPPSRDLARAQQRHGRSEER